MMLKFRLFLHRNFGLCYWQSTGLIGRRCIVCGKQQYAAFNEDGRWIDADEP